MESAPRRQQRLKTTAPQGVGGSRQTPGTRPNPFSTPKCGGMLAFHKFVVRVLRIEIHISETVIEFDIHVRVLLDKYWLPTFFTGPEKGLKPDWHLHFIVDKNSRDVIPKMFPRDRMCRLNASTNAAVDLCSFIGVDLDFIVAEILLPDFH